MTLAPPRALTLVLGGVRSGKSAFAEGLLANHENCTYIATARVLDAGMRERVAEHQRRRGAQRAWKTVEAPVGLPDVLDQVAEEVGPVLVDSLGMWTTNLLMDDIDVDAAFAKLLESLAASPGPLIVVSDEVGLGGVEVNALARRFADCHGRLNQQVAAIARHVYLVTAGIPLLIKGHPAP